MDLDGFKQRVRRNDYLRHKYWFVAAAAGILGMIAFENSYFLLLTGGSLILSGVAVIRAGKRATTGIGVTGWGGSVSEEWSTSEFADMSPDERVDDSNTTGGFLILIGAALLALMAYSAWLQLREYWAAREYRALADAAGLVSLDAPQGTGLCAGSREVCWSDAQTATLCSDPGLVETPRIQSGSTAHELVATPRGLVLASDRDVTWLANSSADARSLRPTGLLFDAGAKALTALGTRVGWVSNADVVIADLAEERPLESPQVVAQVANTAPPLLALAPDAVLYGPTENCALEWQDHEGCAVPAELGPCALGSNQKQLVLLTKHGELWRATVRARFARVASGLRGCLLAVNERFAFVAGEGPITRVDLGPGNHATIFQDGPVSAIALSDRTLYFRTVDAVKGIRIDAPPLR